MPRPICLIFERHLTCLALADALPRAGNSIEANKPVMAITTSNSINVNPCSRITADLASFEGRSQDFDIKILRKASLGSVPKSHVCVMHTCASKHRTPLFEKKRRGLGMDGWSAPQGRLPGTNTWNLLRVPCNEGPLDKGLFGAYAGNKGTFHCCPSHKSQQTVRMFFGSFPLMMVPELSFVVTVRFLRVTKVLTFMEPGMKLFAASKESCCKDTCRHPECDDVANCFHLTRMDVVHVSKQRNLFYKKISTSASVEGQNARFRGCFFPHEMPIVEDRSLVKGVGAIFQASTTCRSYERCSSWTLFNNGCKGKSKSSTPCRNGTESRDEIDLINCYHDSSSVGCYHQRWMQIFCKKIR